MEMLGSFRMYSVQRDNGQRNAKNGGFPSAYPIPLVGRMPIYAPQFSGDCPEKVIVRMGYGPAQDIGSNIFEKSMKDKGYNVRRMEACGEFILYDPLSSTFVSAQMHDSFYPTIRSMFQEALGKYSHNGGDGIFRTFDRKHISAIIKDDDSEFLRAMGCKGIFWHGRVGIRFLDD